MCPVGWKASTEVNILSSCSPPGNSTLCVRHSRISRTTYNSLVDENCSTYLDEPTFIPHRPFRHFGVGERMNERGGGWCRCLWNEGLHRPTIGHDCGRSHAKREPGKLKCRKWVMFLTTQNSEFPTREVMAQKSFHRHHNY